MRKNTKNYDFYNINNEFNKFYTAEELQKNGRYPHLKAYIKAYNDSLSGDYDSDVSEYAMRIYKEKWKCFSDIYDMKIISYYKRNNKMQLYLNDKEYVVRGDTLNSMKHIFTDFLNKYCSGFKNEHKWTNKDYEKTLLNDFDTLFSDSNLDKKDYARLILDEFELFAKNSDTIGNLFPCPPLFNAGRSNYGIYDFCDLLLTAIYDYLNAINEKDKEKANLALKILFKEAKNKDGKDCKDDCIKRTEDFLEKYYNNNWDKFIDDNYFSYYVNPSEEGGNKYGKPKMLWDGHSFNNTEYPEIGPDYLNMLRFINYGIIIRNYQIESAR